MHWANSICYIYIRSYKSGSSIRVCFGVYIRIQHSFLYYGFFYWKHEMDDNVLSVDDENWRGINDRNRYPSVYRQNDTDYDMAYPTIWRVYRILTTRLGVLKSLNSRSSRRTFVQGNSIHNFLSIQNQGSLSDETPKIMVLLYLLLGIGDCKF